MESVKHWIWLLYTPPSEPDSVGQFNPITDVSRVLGEVTRGMEYANIVQDVCPDFVVI
jgi:hypothetical protein